MRVATSSFVKHLDGDIETRLLSGENDRYDHKGKKHDPHKQYFNATIAVYVRDFIDYIKSICLPNEDVNEFLEDGKYLVLDGVELGTTNTLVKSAGVPLKQIHICSKSVEFRHAVSKFSPTTYTGMLSDFLVQQNRLQTVYSVMILDFCGGYTEEPQKCVKQIFEHHMLSPVGVIAFTFAYRAIEKAGYLHENFLDAMDSIQRIAATNGYALGHSKWIQNIGSQVCSLICKFMHKADAMDYENGLRYDRFNRASDNWNSRMPGIITFEEALENGMDVDEYIAFEYRQTPMLKKRKRDDENNTPKAKKTTKVKRVEKVKNATKVKRGEKVKNATKNATKLKRVEKVKYSKRGVKRSARIKARKAYK